MALNALVVGRYAPGFGEGEINIVARENVLFPATAEETVTTLRELEAKAFEAGAKAVLLQNTPGQVAAAMIKVVADTKIHWGVVISSPITASGCETRTFYFDPDIGQMQPQSAEAAVKFAKPRAKVTASGGDVTVEVDPPRRFEFDHIEWFNGEPAAG